MGKPNRTGASSLEMVIFIFLIIVGAIVVNVYWFQKKQAPAPMPPAPTVQDDQPAREPIEPKARPVAVEKPKAAPAPLPVAVVPPPVVALPPPPPPPPLCQILRAQLKDARDALAQAKANLAAAQQTSLATVHQSPEYLAAKADVDAKKQAKDDATATLQNAPSGSPTADMKAAVADTSRNWLDALANMTDVENTAVAADPAVIERQQALKDATAKASGIVKQLTGYVQGEIAKAGDSSQCPISDVSYDTTSWTIAISLCPGEQLSHSAMADVAMTQIGRVLEKTLQKSAYSWSSAIFRVCFEVNGSKAVEFQATYNRDAVDQANFANIDRAGRMDDQALVNLAADFWLSPLVNQAAPTPGRPAAPYDILVIGGYSRMDGSYCPPVYVRCPHDPKRTSAPPSIRPPGM